MLTLPKYIAVTLGRSARGHHNLVRLAQCLLTVCFRLISQRGRVPHEVIGNNSSHNPPVFLRQNF